MDPQRLAWLGDFAARHAIPLFDIQSEFHAMPEWERQPMFRRKDGHLSVHGNDVVAGLLQAGLAARFERFSGAVH
jgi:hypothetical protein